MLVDGAGSFIGSGMRTFIRVLPGGIEAVVGAHGVMSEKLPSVGSICSGICQTQQETINTQSQQPGPRLDQARAWTRPGP